MKTKAHIIKIIRVTGNDSCHPDYFYYCSLRKADRQLGLEQDPQQEEAQELQG